MLQSRPTRHFRGVTRDAGDAVTTLEQRSEQVRADTTAYTNQCDFHLRLMMTYASTVVYGTTQ